MILKQLQNRNLIFSAKKLNCLLQRLYSKEATSDSTQFKNFVNKRKSESRREVLVQVGSEHSFPELFDYCLKFGEIGDCHHFVASKGRNFILLQFSEESSVSELLKNASINDTASSNASTVHSHFLWFKTGKKPIVTDSRQFGKGVLSSKNGLSVPKNEELYSKMRSATTVDEQIRLLYSETRLNDLSIKIRFLAANQIEKALSGMFPSVIAYPFGSSVNGFGKMGCDLDLILKLDDFSDLIDSRLVFHLKENFSNERTQKQKEMEAIGDILHIFLPGIENVRRILHARVPIIKYYHEYLNLECDLSLNDLSGLHMSELFYTFGLIDTRVRELVFTIRKWAQAVGLTNPSPGRWITNFSLSTLVIFFLQQLSRPILPSLNSLIIGDTSNKNDESCINNVNFITTNDLSLEELLLQFFEFYSNFDFFSRAISLNEGKSINKPDHSAIYIVNPFERGHNVSKNVSFEECERLKMEVRNAAWTLESELETSKIKPEVNQENWGILNLFKPNDPIRSHAFYKPRMVDVSELFCKSVK